MVRVILTLISPHTNIAAQYVLLSILMLLHTTQHKQWECLPSDCSLFRGQEPTTETPAVGQDLAEKPFGQSSPSEDREFKLSAESSTVSDDQTRTTTAPDTHKGNVSSTTFVYSMY